MLGPSALLLGAALALGDAPAGPAIRPVEFREWFDAAREGTLVIPEAVERGARRFRYVFVAGFRNERMRGYFAQNARELRASGIPRRSIHFIDPSSHETVEGNADEVRARFLEIAREGPEPLVVIAHSRGACDALAFALRNPRFVRDHVYALFLVQGPFGGTGLADFVTGEGPPLDRRMPLRLRVLAHLLGGLEERQLDKGKHGGLPGLTRQASHDFWDRTLEDFEGAFPIVGPKTFYVTSETDPERLRLFKRATAWYLRTHYGANDGLVALDDQSIPGLGTVLAVLDVGHTDLTNRFPGAPADRQLRKSLVESILMAVGRPSGPPPLASDPLLRRAGRRPGRE